MTNTYTRGLAEYIAGSTFEIMPRRWLSTPSYVRCSHVTSRCHSSFGACHFQQACHTY